MLQEVLDLLESELQMHRGTIMLLSADGGELLVEATKKMGEMAPHNTRYLKGEGITGRVLQTGRPAVIPSISKEPHFQDRIHQRRDLGDHALSFICVPINTDTAVVGRSQQHDRIVVRLDKIQAAYM